MNAERLPEARLRCPQWAADEDAAMKRVRRAALDGDVDAGARALADWIDAQALMLAYCDVYDLVTMH
jgi:hypothetical protein